MIAIVLPESAWVRGGCLGRLPDRPNADKREAARRPDRQQRARFLSPPLLEIDNLVDVAQCRSDLGCRGVRYDEVGGEFRGRVSSLGWAAVCEGCDEVRPRGDVWYDEFFFEEFPRLVAMLTAWAGSRALAQELAQDALLQAQRRWVDVASLDSPRAWVRRVALNRSANEGRRRRRQRAAVRRLGARDVTPEEPALVDDGL